MIEHWLMVIVHKVVSKEKCSVEEDNLIICKDVIIDIIDVVTSWKWFTWKCGVAKLSSTCLGWSNWWTWKWGKSSQSNVKFIVTYIEVRESRILQNTLVSQLNGNPTLSKDQFIALFIHVGQFHDPRIYQLYYVDPSNKRGIFVYYSYIQVELGSLGGIIFPTLCA